MKLKPLASLTVFLVITPVILILGGCAGPAPAPVKPDAAGSGAAAQPAAPSTAWSAERPVEVISGAVGTEEAAAKEKARRPKAEEPAKSTRPVSRTIYSPPEPAAGGTGGGDVVFNFDDADIYEVIKTVGEILNITYMVDPEVRGKVTINTAKGLRKEDLFEIFNQILDLNGLAAVKDGSLYRIVPLKDAQRLPLLSRFGRDSGQVGVGERVIIQLIPLQYISPDEMTKLVTPFVSANGVILSHPGSNTLVVVDKSLNIAKILKLVDVFDVNVFENVQYRVYPLKHMDADEMSKILEDIFSVNGTRDQLPMKFISITSLNIMMVVSSTQDVFPRIEKFIDELDVASEQASKKIYVYYVRNGEAENLASLLESVFSGTGGSAESKSSKSSTKSKSGSRTDPFSRNPFSSSNRSSSSSSSGFGGSSFGGSSFGGNSGFGSSYGSSGFGSSYGSSGGFERGGVGSSLSSGTGGGGTGGGGTTTVAAAVTLGGKDSSGKRTGSTLKDEVTVTADEIRNALIIQAVPADYRVIEDILHKIDVLPRQVLINATIAEITLDKSDQMGVEWKFGAAATGVPMAFGGTAGVAGLTYSIGVTDKWYAALNALASRNKVNVLSSPHVLASDNKEARMDVSREIPVASSSYLYSTTTEPVSQTSIQYRDTGVLLNVTPHINERGLVTMEINQEVSDKAADVTVAGQNYPSFFKRAVNTTLTVGDGQTLVIGGLITDSDSRSFTGVPCLVNTPVLRYLTGTGSNSLTKTELIILITPRVVINDSDVEAVTKEFKEKVSHASKQLK